MPGPKVTRDDAITLFRLLKGKGFRKGREIQMQPRLIRAICTDYPEHFLSTQSGYKLVEDATRPEIQNAVADLRSRCKHMERRASALETILAQ